MTALRDLLEELPDDALLPAGWVRELLVERDVDAGDDLVHLTVDDAARLLGRSASTVRAWCASGRLDAYKLAGREWRITHESLRAFQKAEAARHRARARPTTTGPRRPVDLRSWRKVRRP